MNIEFLDDIKEKILKDINSISAFSKNVVETITYGESKDEFIVNENNPKEDILMHFEKSDLLYALHDATMFVKAKKDKLYYYLHIFLY